MTSRPTIPPQDFEKMCKQAERDQESKKLVVLLERVKRQIAERETPGREVQKPPVGVMRRDFGSSRRPSRSALFER